MKYKYYLSKLKNKRAFLILLLIVILGFVLRLYHLGTSSLSTDEVLTVLRARFSLNELVTSLKVHPPLYYIILRPWVKIFGNSELAIRFPSLIFSVLSIIFIFKLAKELFNEKVGLISAFLLSIWPYSINYAQEARPYAIVWFLGTLSFLFFLRFVKDNKIRSLLSYIITIMISIYTEYLGFIFIIIQNILFFSFFNNKKQSKRWLLGQLAIILLYLPWIKNFLFIAILSKTTPFYSKRTDYFGFLVWLFLCVTGHWTKPIRISLIEVFLYCFLIISAFVRFKSIKNKKNILDFSQSDCLLFSWMVVPIIIFYLIEVYFTPILVPRYFGLIHVPLIILFSKAISKYNIRVKSMVIFLLFSISLSLLYPYYKHDLKYNGQDWRGLHEQLRQKAGNNDLIVYVRGKPVEDYYGKGIEAKSIGRKEFEEIDIDKLNYDSIFFVYTLYKFKEYKIPELKRYKLEEHIRKYRVGFFRFRKL